MATGVTNTNTTEADALIPELWARQTRDSLLSNLISWNLIDRVFGSTLSVIKKKTRRAFSDSFSPFTPDISKDKPAYTKYKPF